MNVRFAPSPHPATLTVEALLTQCELRAVRGSGPGGQHRNKVSTGIAIKYRPLDLTAEATERRSQAQNREVAISRLRTRLAIEVRSEPTDSTTPSGGKLADLAPRYGGVRLRIAESNEDYAVLLALLLDRIYNAGGDLESAAEDLQTSSSQVMRLLRAQPDALRYVNDWRVNHSLRPLR